MSTNELGDGDRPTQPLADGEITARLRGLGGRVAELRRAAGLTQVELAERSAVHFITISRLERGAQNVSVTVVWRLAQALGIEASNLLE